MGQSQGKIPRSGSRIVRTRGAGGDQRHPEDWRFWVAWLCLASTVILAIPGEIRFYQGFMIVE
ncbi:unnamed protein product [Cladocopium goreaui]|uniref:Uncharacterized protein n=1 Tax=Cladocopium goreaui TaxID=2562237 RepID=A0A9P1G1M5_9DINO|nr:unnamed protein product [Cladocopium goreaui]